MKKIIMLEENELNNVRRLVVNKEIDLEIDIENINLIINDTNLIQNMPLKNIEELEKTKNSYEDELRLYNKIFNKLF